MDNKRFDFLDIAKGLGIIFVLFSHSCGFPVLGKTIVAFYMPLFFFISGYTYTPKRSVKENIVRKLKQLLIPYVGFTLLLYAEHVILAVIKHELTSSNLINPLLGALYSRGALYARWDSENVIFMLISNGPMWFITAMALASVIFYLVVDTFLKDKKSRIIISGVLVVITAAFSYSPVLLPWSIDTVFACALFMLVGARLRALNYYGEVKNPLTNVIKVLIAAVVYSVITSYANPINMSLRDYGYKGALGALWFVAVSLIGSAIFLWLCKYLEKIRIKSIIIAVGRHTFSIMSLHTILFKYLNKVYYVLGMSFEFKPASPLYWLYWIGIFVVVIVCCIVFDYVIGKANNVIRLNTRRNN